uniref:GRIP and coiled-coil domain-containing protein 1 isoform X2 n=1 Tax=Myxine glutinosa TaxID=7769 RepID=UPI00358F7F3A
MERLSAALTGGSSQKELFETVETQKRQLSRYESRLRDMVRAYRSLLAEKAALEAGLAALNASSKAEARGEAGIANETISAVDTEAVGLLQARLSTLTSALTTVTQEKSRMEAAYQADKRLLRQEMEETNRKNEEELVRLRDEVQHLGEKLKEARGRVSSQQQERTREHADHAAMLRELQRLLAEERARREEMEISLAQSEMHKEAAIEELNQVRHREECESVVSGLSSELAKLRQQLLDVEEQRSRPDPLLEQLQREASEMQAEFRKQLQQEAEKALINEEALRCRTEVSEARAADLELRLSELAQTLGSVARERHVVVAMNQQLRERVTQLEEDASLSQPRVGTRPCTEGPGAVSQLFSRLESTIASTANVVNMEEKYNREGQDDDESGKVSRLPEGSMTDCEKASVLVYQQEIQQLRAEMSTLRLQSNGSCNTEVDGEKSVDNSNLQRQLSELQEKYHALNLHCQELEEHCATEPASLRRELALVQQQHRHEVLALKASYQNRAQQLEQEMRRQRDRSLALLKENDHEIELLRGTARVLQPLHLHDQSGSTRLNEEVKSGEWETWATPEEPTWYNEQGPLRNMLSLPALSQATLLYYTEQISRRDVELVSLRRENRMLEQRMWALQQDIATMEDAQRQEVQGLQEQIDKFSRDRSRDGASLEYLKNVVFRFLTLGGVRDRQHALNAIATVLQFSPKERKAVLGP